MVFTRIDGEAFQLVRSALLKQIPDDLQWLKTLSYILWLVQDDRGLGHGFGFPIPNFWFWQMFVGV